MAWETPHFDPSNTFGNFALRSAQAAAPIGQAFATGMQIGARRRENADLEGLQKKLREYQIEKAQLDIADALNQREQQKQVRNAMTETSHLLTESYQKGWWATPDGLNKIGEGLAGIQARIPAVAESDTFKGMWTTLQQRRQQLEITERGKQLENERQANRLELEKERSARATTLEELRQKNRVALENLRQNAVASRSSGTTRAQWQARVVNSIMNNFGYDLDEATRIAGEAWDEFVAPGIQTPQQFITPQSPTQQAPAVDPNDPLGILTPNP